MIPRSAITEWRNTVPWQEDHQVEQDLIICRALTEIYSDPYLHDRLVFRGGTAMYKLYSDIAVRYSEDIDLVQIKPEPIKKTIEIIREKLKFLGKANTDQKERNTNIFFRFNSEIEPVLKMKLKIEINCREHVQVFGIKDMDFKVDSLWHKGQSKITTYEIEELLGSKLRALHQRKKGRDLFDMWYIITQMNADVKKVITAYNKIIEAAGTIIHKKDFLSSLEDKMKDESFRSDMNGLINPQIEYDIDEAYEFVKSNVIELI